VVCLARRQGALRGQAVVGREPAAVMACILGSVEGVGGSPGLGLWWKLLVDVADGGVDDSGRLVPKLWGLRLPQLLNLL